MKRILIIFLSSLLSQSFAMENCTKTDLKRLQEELFTNIRYRKSTIVADIKFYIAQGGPVNVRDLHGYTFLILAAREGLSDACTVLIQLGADPFCADNLGCTAISEAAISFYKNHQDPNFHPIHTGLKGSKQFRDQRVAQERREYQKVLRLLMKCYHQDKKDCVAMKEQVIEHGKRELGYFEYEWIEGNI